MWLLVAHQLENARLLARIDKGRPRQASLRRSVSTAYYALFQAICEVCAAELVGWGKPWEAFTPIFRSLDHSRVLEALRNPSMADKPELVRLSFAFGELKAAREWADYNPEPRPRYGAGKPPKSYTRSESLTLIELAEEAIILLDRIDKPTRLKLAVRLVTKSKK